MTIDWSQLLSFAVAIGTVALAVYAGLTFRGLKEQMKLLHEQSASMKRQADAMEGQSKFIRNQSDAMTTQAKTMMDQAEIMGKQVDLIQEQVKQNNENIVITRNKILQDSYLKEMDSIIGPLRSKIGKYQYYEPIHVTPENEREASLFWEKIKKNRYLVPKDLRDLIERYLTVLEVQGKEIRKTRYELEEMTHPHGEAANEAFLSKMDLSKSASNIIDTSYIGPAPVDEGLGSYLKKIEDLAKSPNKDLANRLRHFHSIAQEGYGFKDANNYSVKNTRFDLEKAGTDRYNYLENTIEKLRTEIER